METTRRNHKLEAQVFFGILGSTMGLKLSGKPASRDRLIRNQTPRMLEKPERVRPQIRGKRKKRK